MKSIAKVYFKLRGLRAVIRSKLMLNFYRIFFLENIDIYKITLGKGSVFDFGSDNFKIDINELKLRDYCAVRMRGKGHLKIGKGVFFNSFSSINCMDSIKIGDNSIFGENVKIYDHNHGFRDKSQLIHKQGYTTGKIVIGNNCWIGSNVTILKGVTIGDNSVVGSGCTIFKDIPDNVVVVSEVFLQKKSY